MKSFDMFKLALLLLPCILVVAFIGYVAVHVGKRSSEFKAECYEQRGAVIEGRRSPDLCVRDGLIFIAARS